MDLKVNVSIKNIYLRENASGPWIQPGWGRGGGENTQSCARPIGLQAYRLRQVYIISGEMDYAKIFLALDTRSESFAK
jgi:hypothetical protein